MISSIGQHLFNAVFIPFKGSNRSSKLAQFIRTSTTYKRSFSTIDNKKLTSNVIPTYSTFKRQYQSSTDLRKPFAKLKSIFALSTPWGVSGISIIRVSGPMVPDIIDKMVRSPLPDMSKVKFPAPRKAYLRTVVDPNHPNSSLSNGSVIDEGLVVYFPEGESYTGEEMLEFQLHGSLAVIKDTLLALSRLSPSELVEAGPGDFTKRAWMNGKIGDLTRLEAISDLIASETTLQRQQALEQLSGSLGDLYHGWSERIVRILAHVEAFVDFGTDEMIDELEIQKTMISSLDSICNEIKLHLSDYKRGEVLRNGIPIVLVGRPNAGKSSLMNILSRRDCSIVSNEAGTTRDIVESKIDLQGYPIIFQDTAGLNPLENIGTIEKEGIHRALKRFKDSTIKLIVIDLTDDTHSSDRYIQEMALSSSPLDTILILNKVDLVLKRQPSNSNKMDSIIPGWILKDPSISAMPRIVISCGDPNDHQSSRIGIPELESAILQAIRSKFATGTGFLKQPALTRQRHRVLLEECLACLERAKKDSPDFFNRVELVAEDLRLAVKRIGKITGKVDVEQILEVIFSDFCIGK